MNGTIKNGINGKNLKSKKVKLKVKLLESFASFQVKWRINFESFIQHSLESFLRNSSTPLRTYSGLIHSYIDTHLGLSDNGEVVGTCSIKGINKGTLVHKILILKKSLFADKSKNSPWAVLII
jgi:hypothetical protein